MTAHRFTQVDVFTDVALLGNPVAVVFDADSLGTEQMQQIARWTNLSETTFVLPATHPEADYRLRIFTPGGELPFAGHPTLGSAHAVIERKMIAADKRQLVQQCEVGLVALKLEDDPRQIFLQLPAATVIAVDQPARDALAHALGLALPGPVEIVALGPRWLIVEIDTTAQLLALTPDADTLIGLSKRYGLTGLTAFSRNEAQMEVRSFAPAMGIAEDPVCGSGNGAVAAFLRAHGECRDYSAHQGQRLGRKGVVALRYGPNQSIFLGGQAVSCIEGTLNV